jgi:hypothetical protein
MLQYQGTTRLTLQCCHEVRRSRPIWLSFQRVSSLHTAIGNINKFAAGNEGPGLTRSQASRIIYNTGISEFVTEG